MGLEGFSTEIGSPANLVVLDQPNVLEALRFHEKPLAVITDGKVIDQEKMEYIIKNKEWK